jgi:hypothetical protein
MANSINFKIKPMTKETLAQGNVLNAGIQLMQSIVNTVKQSPALDETDKAFLTNSATSVQDKLNKQLAALA